MIVRITIWSRNDPTESPRVDDADEGGVVRVAKVAGEGVGGEEVAVEDFPGAAVG
jgi:hypothetical protein